MNIQSIGRKVVIIKGSPMVHTALHDMLKIAGRIATYGGAETPASFGDVPKETTALLEGCGIYDLGWRAKLIVKGADRDRWMNGMITNNIRDLAKDRGVYGFLLNPH